MENMSNNNDGYGSPQRKATDILLAIESKMEVLQKLVHNQDMLLKITADKTNKIFTYITELQQEYKQTQEEQVQEEEPGIMHISNEHQIVEAKEQVGQRRIDRVGSQPSPQPILAIPNQSNQPSPIETVQATQNGDKKVPVIQRIADQTSKDIFMANVIILDHNGKEVHKTKTNAVGKWQAILKPGNYTVNINKTDTTTKKILQSSQNIIVNNSNSTITLPVHILYR